ncbi:MAG TPA: DUF2357 domain-containing protein [Anaerolineae bacterium]|nr:DUF2357 domain-containing protein [Anaerolineae bacterium]HQI85148.1 DUF2357 domain-containing protein [Anaerolineae bacterium]
MNVVYTSLLEQFSKAKTYPIPVDMQQVFAPASRCLLEWEDYWVEIPEADTLRVGTMWYTPKLGHYFNVCFENQLGLTEIQPYARGYALCPPLHVEVISPKFATTALHLNFYQGLLEDLFIRATRLPFTIQAETQRGVTESLRPPTPLFMLHFLCQYAMQLRDALALIQFAPHRNLIEFAERVPLAMAVEADADVLLSIVAATEEWQPTEQRLPLVSRLQGHAPAHVWQRRSEETCNTPENRFVLHFLRQLLVAAESLPRQLWWKNVPPKRQRLVLESISLVRQTIEHPMFDEVEAMHILPLTSQVLLRRDGYREMLELWQQFQRARRPLFGALAHAIEVRDVATLYEIWAFFALIEEIAVIVKESPTVAITISTEQGVEYGAKAHFGRAGALVYNRGFSYPTSYSVPLRPDFTWMRDGKPEVVLDAKFRLEHLPGADEEDIEVTTTPGATAKRADLYKMHTYRDALGVRSAIAVYPGDQTVFYGYQRRHITNMMLPEIFLENLPGIGALPMRPSDSGGR